MVRSDPVRAPPPRRLRGTAPSGRIVCRLARGAPAELQAGGEAGEVGRGRLGQAEEAGPAAPRARRSASVSSPGAARRTPGGKRGVGRGRRRAAAIRRGRPRGGARRWPRARSPCAGRRRRGDAAGLGQGVEVGEQRLALEDHGGAQPAAGQAAHEVVGLAGAEAEEALDGRAVEPRGGGHGGEGAADGGEMGVPTGGCGHKATIA